MAYEEFTIGIFICCREKVYAAKRRTVDRLYEKNVTPLDQDLSAYKLHISLSADDYILHQAAIKGFLLQHLKNEVGALKDFKYVDVNLIRFDTEQSKELIQLLLEYRKNLESGVVDNAMMSVLEKQWIEYHGEDKNLPEPNQIENAINQLNNEIKIRDRFLDGDQFTIYIPHICDVRLLVDLCKQVNNYLLENKAVPGTHSNVSSPINDYISLRQDYLLQDFEKMNRTGLVDMTKRIDSVPLKELTAEDERRRQQIKLEQEKSPIYEYIINQLKPKSKHAKSKPSAAAHAVMFKEKEKGKEKGKEKEVKKKSEKSKHKKRSGRHSL